MKKTYKIPTIIEIAINTKQILATSDPQPTVDPNNPVGDDSGNYSKTHNNVWDEEW